MKAINPSDNKIFPNTQMTKSGSVPD